MPAPANDNFASPHNLVGASGTYNAGLIDDATLELGEPRGSDIAIDTGVNQTMWFTWTAPAGIVAVTFDTDASTAGDPGSGDSDGRLDTNMTVWTGTSLGALVEVGSNEDIGADHYTSRVMFTPTEGTTYRIQVGTYSTPFTGTVVLTWESEAAVGGVRIAVAFDDPTLEPSPTWTYLTDTDNLAAGYTIDAGRQYEFDKTDGSTATIRINDVDGVLDPTNAAGPYYGLLEPLLQVQIELYNPVAATWSTRFRGFIEDYDYSVDPSQDVTRLEIGCVDMFAILTPIEMQPGEFGDVGGEDGTVFFDYSNANDRISQALTDAGLPAEFFVVFSLNVNMQPYGYSPGENVLQVVQDCADAEMPTVSNVYCDRTGRLAVHGRFAKFDPVGTAAGADPGAWLFTYWKCGDHTAVAASPTDTAQIRALSFNRGLSQIRNSCLCTPTGIFDSNIAAQLVKDTASIAQYGIRSWSAENLLIGGPTAPTVTSTPAGTTTGNNALDETLAFGTFMKNRYAQPHNRISELTFRSMRPEWPGAGATWALLCEADVSDLIDVTETSPGGGGFTADTHFIEGRHETAEPLNGLYANVTLTLDVSPGEVFIGHGHDTGAVLDG